MIVMPSSPNRKRLEVPTYYFDALKRIADAEDRTVANVLGELLFAALRDYRPSWIPKAHLGRLTRRARAVLDRAQGAVPASFGHNYVGTEHILLALGEDGEGLAGRVLAGAGVLPADVRAELESIVGRGEAPPDTVRELVPRARKVLGLAVAEADHLGHGFVGTGHLLLGLLREGQGIAAGILNRREVDLEDLTAATLRALTGGTTPLAET
ncbi:MAG TPA: Clp protease N-terminal domain-containing protein [Chloroflexota bacterium]|jgi:ATP-dependent Clp protease ATP-binding subunit ClpC|nr:Clp protease N-terminal domain-containing protein [Chloroflexota bacterium]